MGHHHWFPLPTLRCEGDLARFDGPLLTDAEKTQIRAERNRRDRRNARRRARYAAKKAQH